MNETISELDQELHEMLHGLSDGFGVTFRDYSYGRGMRGEPCAAVVLNSMDQALRFMLALGESVEAAEGMPLQGRLKLNNVRHDSMGSSVVLYWPTIAAPVNKPEEEA